MRILYLDCGMGAAGDMLTAALLELLPDPGAFLSELNAVGIPGVEYVRERAVKCGVAGTHISVRIGGREASGHDGGAHGNTHFHADMHGIGHIVSGLFLPEPVKADVLAVYGLIAGAESAVHGVPVPEIHFHEVGTPM